MKKQYGIAISIRESPWTNKSPDYYPTEKEMIGTLSKFWPEIEQYLSKIIFDLTRPSWLNQKIKHRKLPKRVRIYYLNKVDMSMYNLKYGSDPKQITLETDDGPVIFRMHPFTDIEREMELCAVQAALESFIVRKSRFHSTIVAGDSNSSVFHMAKIVHNMAIISQQISTTLSAAPISWVHPATLNKNNKKLKLDK